MTTPHNLHSDGTFDNPVAFDLDGVFHEEIKKVKAAQSRVGPETLRVYTELTDTNQGAFLELLRNLHTQCNVARLIVRVRDDVKVMVSIERRILQAINDLPYDLHWDYQNTKDDVIPDKIHLRLGGLFYLSEHGTAVFNSYMSKEGGEAMKAIRANNVPWSLKFLNVTIKENEILSDKEIHRLALRAPAMVRLRRLWRAVQRLVRQIPWLRT